MTAARVRGLAACVGMLFVCSGCATQTYHAYAGPGRPAAEIARLDFQSMGMRYIKRVDGVVIHDGQRFGRLLLLPGPHEVEVEYDWSNRHRQVVRFPFEVEAGQRYQISSLAKDPPPRQTIVDAAVDAGLLVALAFTWPVVVPVAMVAPQPPRPAAPPEGGVLVMFLKRSDGRAVSAWSQPQGFTVRERRQPLGMMRWEVEPITTTTTTTTSPDAGDRLWAGG
jgi:hypothetical protein